jgi:hypothetical protein
MLLSIAPNRGESVMVYVCPGSTTAPKVEPPLIVVEMVNSIWHPNWFFTFRVMPFRSAWARASAKNPETSKNPIARMIVIFGYVRLFIFLPPCFES